MLACAAQTSCCRESEGRAAYVACVGVRTRSNTAEGLGFASGNCASAISPSESEIILSGADAHTLCGTSHREERDTAMGGRGGTLGRGAREGDTMDPELEGGEK